MTHFAKVEVYYNLHRKCLSVRSRITGPTYGKVLAHVDHIVLRDVEFKVSEAGRRRVIREQRKNVHAVIRGERAHVLAARGHGDEVRVVAMSWLREVMAGDGFDLCHVYVPGYDNVVPGFTELTAWPSGGGRSWPSIRSMTHVSTLKGS